MFSFAPKRAKDAKISHTFEVKDTTLGKHGNKVGLPEDFPFDPLRSWKRARIPVWLSEEIAKHCASELKSGLRLEVRTIDSSVVTLEEYV